MVFYKLNQQTKRHNGSQSPKWASIVLEIQVRPWRGQLCWVLQYWSLLPTPPTTTNSQWSQGEASLQEVFKLSHFAASCSPWEKKQTSSLRESIPAVKVRLTMANGAHKFLQRIFNNLNFQWENIIISLSEYE